MTEPSRLTLSETADFLRAHDNFLILCHANPDGDTLGSGIGLREILRKMGKTAHCACASHIPHRLSFITEEKESMYLEELPADFSYTTVVSVDIASPSLMGAYQDPFGEDGNVDLAIDHHGTHTPFAKQLLLYEDMAACAEVIFDLGKHIFDWNDENPVPREIAVPLYAGINTDSGSFRYAAVTPETHERAAMLLSSGMEQAKITSRLYGSRPMPEVMAAKAAYADLRFFFDNRVSLVTFTEETMQKYGLRDEDIDDVVNLIRGIEGVLCAVHVKPRGENTYKLSLRSEQCINVSEICAVFGGGGHPCAAGCTITAETPQAVEDLILAEIEKQLP